MIYTTPSGPAYSLYLSALSQPHLMIAGATGSGKSVLVNGLIYTALYRFPDDKDGGAQFVLIDPKRVELVQYKHLPHTVKYASEPAQMVNALEAAMAITETRYKLMAKRRLRKYDGGDLYVIIDEAADLMTTNKKAVQPLIQRLAQIGRAANVHIILCTQCPLAAVIPTPIKVNFDARFGLRARSAQDSRNIMGFKGCENLPKYGEGYYLTPEGHSLYNIPMIPDDELQGRVDWWMRQTSIFRRIFG